MRRSKKVVSEVLLEQLSERFFACYTCDKADVATRRVNHWITRSPDLDSTWFSSRLLQRLWDSELYQQGRITNRSESFEEHRNIVRYLYKTYDAMLTHTEATAWHRMEEPLPLLDMMMEIRP